VLLLVSHQPSRLLPTIKSRCQQVACPQPSVEHSQAWLASALPDCDESERQELLTLAAGSPLRAATLQAQGIREQRARVTDGVKKLLKQQQSPSQLAEAWGSVPLLLLFDWFFEWSQLILRYQLTQDEEGLGLADMRKVVQYLAQKARQDKVLQTQAWVLEQRQKVLGKTNLNRVLLLEALLAHWVQLPGSR
jgi:DNA polymerase-3 subunit delta'